MSYPGQIRVAGAARPSLPPETGVVSGNDKATPADQGSGRLNPYAVGYTLLFILALPTVSGAWYWGTTHLTDLSTQGVKTVIPQYLLWLCLPLAITVHLRRKGLRFYKASVGLFAPFLICGVISSVVGIFPISSLKTLVFWLAFVSAGILLAGETEHRTAVRLLFYVVLSELILSILIAVLIKSAGTIVDIRNGGVSWRGAFEGRIPLSEMALWGIVLTLYRKEVGWISTAAMLGCALLCLYESHAAGTIVALFAAGALWIALITLRRWSLPNAAKSAIVLAGCATGLLAILILLPAVLGALGRDTTFTGRTTIWAAYLPKALQHPILGQGPTSFTSLSPITAELFYRLSALGIIRTPHNTFIAVLGEGGIVGVLALFGMLAYVAVVLPFRDNASTSLVCAVGAVSIITIGLSEAIMVYSPGPSTFVFVMLLALRAHNTQTAKAAGIAEPTVETRPLRSAASGIPSLGGALRPKFAGGRSVHLGRLPRR